MRPARTKTSTVPRMPVASTAPRMPVAFTAPVANRSNALHAGAWWLWALGLAVAASRTTNPLLLGLLVGTVTVVGTATGRLAPAAAPPDGVTGVARLLFTDYLLPFELTGVLLLAAMVGVLVLARRRA